MIFRYSIQQPKWITVNNNKKLQGFHNNPVSMTTTKMAAVSDILIDVPSRRTPDIQQVHICLYHYLCEMVEARLTN